MSATALRRDHLVALARRHRVKVTWVGTWQEAMSYPALHEACLPEPVTPVLYLVALHELGHVADRTARRLADREDVYGVVTAEGAAWAWAACHAAPVHRRWWNAALALTYASYLATASPHEAG